ncbi:MAG: hypothetical protein KAH30_06065, partial [Caldisericia bacterium]|nr:hypothetical protein [Caldisericia bacterium]
MKLIDIAKKALNTASGDKVDVIVRKTDEALTRFANSYIHQNVKQTDGMVKIRVFRDGKTGMAMTNSFEESSVIACAKKANELAELAVKNPVEFDLPGKSEYKTIPEPDKKTINLSPKDRADIVSRMISVAKKDNLIVAGSVVNELESYCIVNNNGIEIEQQNAQASIGITAMSDDSSGQADMSSPRITDINPEEL